MAGRLKDLLSRARQDNATVSATPRPVLSHVAPPTELDTRQNTYGTYWRFLVRYSDGSGFEARTLPEATEAEARQLWPGCAVEPLVDGDSESA